MEYDVIGDIHGKGSLLEGLLRQLGYTERSGTWVPPSGRQAIFLGDLIDRGEEQLKVLDIVRRMVDAGHAKCVLGNHELNAIGWVTEDPDRPGQFLRPHTPGKRKQHQAFLDQVGEGSARHREAVAWFRTLPPVLDLGGIRAVHAWWNPDHVDFVARQPGGGRLEGDEGLVEVFRRGSPAWQAYEGLTKGHELDLPARIVFEDKGGTVRNAVRTQWWRDDVRDYREVAAIEERKRPDIPALPLPKGYRPTPVSGAPVFIGHYWLEGPLAPRNGKLACLDFSVGGGGPLVAYRWCGEPELTSSNFVKELQ
jgi:hypothetical protein